MDYEIQVCGCSPDLIRHREIKNGLDTSDNGGIGDALPVLVLVAEGSPRPPAGVTGCGVADIAKAFFRNGGCDLGGAVQNLFLVASLSEHGPVPRKHPGVEAPLLSKGMKTAVSSVRRSMGRRCRSVAAQNTRHA